MFRLNLSSSGISLTRKVKRAKVSSNTINKVFEVHYNTYIKPKEVSFEERRKVALRRYNFRIFISVIIALPILFIAMNYIMGSNSEKEQEVISGIMILAIIGAYYWCRRPVKRYNSKIKSEIFPEIFKFFGKSFSYSEKSNLDLGQLSSDSEIIPSYDNAKCEDHVTGRVGGVDLELVEAWLTERRGSGKNRRTVTVFKGLFILFSMNKDFSGKTLVKKDWGKIGNFFVGKFSRKYSNVKLEDPEFEKQFEIYASDQVEARYLLTTSFMERLKGLSDLLAASIQASFFDNKLMIMVNAKKNLFELSSIRRPVNFIRDVNMVLEEMKIVMQIIKELKLDQRTGL